MSFRFVFLIISLFMLPSCMTVGPNYKRPDTKMPDFWTMEIDADNRSPVTGAQLWWRKFNDPVLDKLVTQARMANPNIYIARKRITTSWHQRSVLAGALYPNVAVDAREEHGLLNYDVDEIDVDISGSMRNFALLNYGWELDVFGRIKRTVEAAEGEYEAQIEGWRDAMVFISAEVALTYIAYRTLERRMEVAQEGVNNFLDIRNRIHGRLTSGVSSELEMAEAEARFKSSEGELPRLQQEIDVLRNRLCQLTAVDPSLMPTVLAKNVAKIPAPPGSVASGAPADLLRSRPDIRRAERKMAAQTARIGIAKAIMYPEFSLSGALRYEYIRRGSTTELLERVLGGGGNFRWRVFNACTDCSRVKENEALLDQAIGEYQQVILQAVADVEDAMSRLHYTKERWQILQDAREAHYKASDLMNEAYLAGEVDLRRLLNAQVDYIATLDEEIATEGRRAAHTVRLFKALGGGELAGAPKEKHYKSKAKRGFWSFLKRDYGDLEGQGYEE